MKLQLGISPKYWYEFHYDECVACGRGRQWKERKYTPKPTDFLKIHHDHQHRCSQCMLYNNY